MCAPQYISCFVNFWTLIMVFVLMNLGVQPVPQVRSGHPSSASKANWKSQIKSGKQKIYSIWPHWEERQGYSQTDTCAHIQMHVLVQYPNPSSLSWVRWRLKRGPRICTPKQSRSRCVASTIPDGPIFVWTSVSYKVIWKVLTAVWISPGDKFPSGWGFFLLPAWDSWEIFWFFWGFPISMVW